jgi:hypothetical protein
MFLATVYASSTWRIRIAVKAVPLPACARSARASSETNGSSK